MADEKNEKAEAGEPEAKTEAKAAAPEKAASQGTPSLEAEAVLRSPERAPGSFRAILGRKAGMTQIFTDDGECKAVTVVEAGPCTVLRVKTRDGKDGYSAVLLGFGSPRAKAVNKPSAGNFKAWGSEAKSFLKEFRVADAGGFSAGQIVDLADRFSVGDYVDVQSTSKGKGFAGVMKRHNFRGLPASHGASDKERSPGSLASRRSLGRVLPGQRMAGRLGGETVTVAKIAVVSVDAEGNKIYLNGSVPGPDGALVVVRETGKLVKKVRAKAAAGKKAAGFAGKVEKSGKK